MIFEDIFYPGNREKRIRIEALRRTIEDDISGYQAAWNELADLMNDAIRNSKYEEAQKISFPKLKKTWKDYPLDECVTEIKEALEETQKTLDNLVRMLNIDKYIDRWGEHFDIKSASVSDLKKIGAILDSVLGGVAAFVVGGYIFTGLAFTQVVSLAVGGAFSTATVVLGSIFGGLLAGGVVFVAVDAIVSAIEGAVERKRLREALDCYEIIHNEVSGPLHNATPTLRYVKVIVTEQKRLDLGHGYFLTYDKNTDTYVIVYIPEFADEVMCRSSVLSAVSEDTVTENPYDSGLDELKERYPSMQSFVFCKA